MDVRAADQSKSEWVEPEIILQGQAFLEAISDHRCREDTACLLTVLADGKKLLERAIFVGCTKPDYAFGIAFDLEHLNQRFHLLAKTPIFVSIRITINRNARESEAP